MTTVGTPFSVSWRGITAGAGTLGSDDVLLLPAGEYLVTLDSDPPRQAPVVLESEVRHTLVFDGDATHAGHKAWREGAEYSACDEQVAALEASSSPESRRASTASSRGGAVAKRAPLGASEQDIGGPKARREALFQLEDGTVEVWQNLRSDRTADWGVVVRHPSVGSTPRMIFSGNDRSLALAAAEKAHETLRVEGSLDAGAGR
jgi:hypothetical protein